MTKRWGLIEGDDFQLKDIDYGAPIGGVLHVEQMAHDLDDEGFSDECNPPCPMTCACRCHDPEPYFEPYLDAEI